MKEPFLHPGFGNVLFLKRYEIFVCLFYIFFYLYFLVFVPPGTILTKPFVP